MTFKNPYCTIISQNWCGMGRIGVVGGGGGKIGKKKRGGLGLRAKWLKRGVGRLCTCVL